MEGILSQYQEKDSLLNLLKMLQLLFVDLLKLLTLFQTAKLLLLLQNVQ